MKKHLQWLGYSLLFCVLFISNGNAQITYSENFDDDDHGWGLYSFGESDMVPCEGAGGLLANIYEWEDYADMLSPSLGTADGNPVIFTYQYKLLQYDSTEPTEPVLNEDDWGAIGVFYATSPTGPFIPIDEVNTTNHTESASCETRTVVFTPPAGSQVYIGIAAQLDYWDNDYYVFIDDINIDAAPDCTGTPAASAAIASSTTVCETQEISLGLSPGYDVAGLDYQWQTSTDGTNFTDVATGGSDAGYVTTQTETTWYRAVVSCPSGGDEVISEPVMVTSTGLPCYCDIVFDGDVEPITYVNFAGIDNETSATINGTPGVENFTSLPPAEVTVGQTYTITLEGNTAGSYETPFTVYIDFNQNGVLDDEGEVFQAGSVDSSTGVDGQQAITEITIPATAMEGLTYMRVLKLFDEYSTDPCSSEDGVGYGQAEDYLINISPCTTEAPIAEADQTFCLEASIQDLVTGSTLGDTILWYADETGGEPLEASTMLVDGTTYYASLTPEGGCESTERTPVTANITTVESATVQTTQPTCTDSFGVIEIIAPLGAAYQYSIDGENYQSSPVFENVLPESYNVVVSVDGCNSNAVDVIIDPAPETPEMPTVSITQPTCDNPTGTIEVTSPLGEDMTYTIDGAIYQASPIFSGLNPGNYLVTAQNSEGCISEPFTAVIEPVQAIDAPTADAEQLFCNTAVIDDLEADGDVVWYAAATDGEILDEEMMLANGVTYYAAQTDGECESTERTAVTVTINVVPAPTGESTQQFEYDSDMLVYPIVDQIVVEGVDGAEFTWYASEEDAIAGENAISTDTEMTESATYYVTQTVDGCESEPFAVTVDIILSNENFVAGSFTYHPNPVNDILNLSYTNVIERVEVYNLIGQKVSEKHGNQNEMIVNMTELSAGTYLVKVTSEGVSKTIKVVKQ
ncbi:T9SS type A sorting domain-containing protein [Flavobacterium salilacus subsp. salilacus]|uniref:T9SS type A sorting domain-containing protein n=1 Tax=Flavobacterium TaxID=237 RepID=UPI001074BA1E|nr:MULTISPECIES: T9SS type A sorting domain-containing protein [Flavobacterium]KAF2519481.1 T9SS type A sorting domain-containing protein [Flavobacterium salilacus subsp. salilacus]MBE1614622.1 T9SS type A sorting domain-containing protein [Flavobacterium sp. SaA2.13]